VTSAANCAALTCPLPVPAGARRRCPRVGVPVSGPGAGAAVSGGAVRRLVPADRAPLGAALDPGGGDGAATAGGPVGPGGRRPVRLRCALAVRGRGGRRRPGRADGLVRVHGAGGLPRPATSLGRPGSDLPGDLPARPPGGAGGGAAGTGLRPLEDAVATQDTVTMLRGAIRGLLRACPPPLAPRSGACWLARTTTPRRASPSATGRTGPRGRRWWTRWSATPTEPTTPCGTSGWTREPPRRPRCWPR
jgi:hypothetical protein